MCDSFSLCEEAETSSNPHTLFLPQYIYQEYSYCLCINPGLSFARVLVPQSTFIFHVYVFILKIIKRKTSLLLKENLDNIVIWQSILCDSKRDRIGGWKDRSYYLPLHSKRHAPITEHELSTCHIREGTSKGHTFRYADAVNSKRFLGLSHLIVIFSWNRLSNKKQRRL